MTNEKKKIIQFKPTHKLLICTSELPVFNKSDTRFYDRLKLIPFKKKFTKSLRLVGGKHESN